MSEALSLRIPPAEEAERGRPRTSTPARLRSLSLAVMVGAGVLALAGTAALALTQTTIDSIGHRTVPAIIDAQKIHESLADADRSAANDFLSGGVELGAPRKQYLSDINAATSQLQQASEHNAVGSKASRKLQDVSAKVTEYTGLVETARAYNRVGYPVGATYLRTSSRLMHDPQAGILVDVDALDRLNYQDLGRENTLILIAAGALAAFYIVGLGLLVILAYTQGFVRTRFRRRRNLGVLAAMVLLLVLGGGLGVQASYTYVNIREAQLQTFNRLHLLWQARSLAVDANGNESLSLIARGTGASFDEAFKAQTKQLVDRPLTDATIDAAARGDVRFKGMLADEIKGATFAGERDAAVLTLRAYQQFLQIDQAVRDKAASDRDGAVALALGSGPGQLGAAFAALDASLGKVIGLIRERYDAAIATASPNLTLDAGVPLCALAIVLFVYWGLKPRLAEYAA